MLLTCSGRDSRRHADNFTRNIDNSGHSRPARTFTKSPKTAKVEFNTAAKKFAAAAAIVDPERDATATVDEDEARRSAWLSAPLVAARLGRVSQ